jgi:hypothetical protein
MSKFDKGRVKQYQRTVYGIVRIDQLENQAATKIGRQSKQGAKKGRGTPGQHWNQIRRGV